MNHVPELLGTDRAIGHRHSANRRLREDRRKQEAAGAGHPEATIRDARDWIFTIGPQKGSQSVDRSIRNILPIGSARLTGLQRHVPNRGTPIDKVKHEVQSRKTGAPKDQPDPTNYK